MADSRADEGRTLKIKLLPPDSSEIPPAVFANHIFVSRQDNEIWLVFMHARGPLGSPVTDEQARVLENEGARPVAVGSVVLPTAVVPGLVRALRKVFPDAVGAEEETVQ